MSKRQPEPLKVHNHPLFDVRIKLVDHLIWKGLTGHITTVYNNGDVLALMENRITAKAKPTEYEVTFWAHLNTEKQCATKHQKN